MHGIHDPAHIEEVIMALRTPLHDWHASHGGKMVEFAGWDMPLHYEGGILAEHRAVRRAGGIFDVSHMGRLRLTGPGRLDFLQKVLSNNCLALEPDQAHYTMITTPTGGALDDAFLYRFGEDDYLLVVNAANHGRDLAYLGDQAAAMGGVDIEDVTSELALLALQGPASHLILAGLGRVEDLPQPRQGRLAVMNLAGARVLVSRTGYTGEPNSFELFVPASQAVDPVASPAGRRPGTGPYSGRVGGPGHPAPGSGHAPLWPRVGPGS